MYLAAAHNIQIPPKECIVVEDAISGLQAARAAGIGYIIGIGAPDAQARLLACDGVSAVIESLAQFPRERLASPADAR
jgi:beta-phosphoglucomutase-like phosphatase (HAD superfamily)